MGIPTFLLFIVPFCVGFGAMWYPATRWLELGPWSAVGACAVAGVSALVLMVWLLFRNSHWQ